MQRTFKKAGFQQGLYQQCSTRKERLGTMRVMLDGREFVYCKNGTTDLAAGFVCATPISTPMNEQTVTIAHPIGTKTVVMTDSGSGIAEDALRDGTLIVTAGAGIGESYNIAGNTAATAGATFSIFLEEPLATAWIIGTTDITVYPNRYLNVIVNPTDGQSLPVCVPQRAVTANYYFWGQTAGHGAMVLDIAAQTTGLELDEKIINPSLTVAGAGFVDVAPDATKVLAGYRHLLGYVVNELDLIDAEATMVQIKIEI